MWSSCWVRGGRAVACIGAAVVLSACGSGSSATKGAQGRVGALEVVNAFLPLPASPTVAAVYLTVRNSGSSPDSLTDISSPDAQTSMLMTEADSGSVGTMQALTDLAIPGHAEASLTPGHDHAMLQHPTVRLKVGQRVPLTLHFAKAGNVTIQVPVVPLGAITQGAGSGMADMPGM